MPLIDADNLESACARIFVGAGLEDGEARLIAHSLVLSNMMGHDSHGVIRITQYVDFITAGKVVPGRRIQIVREAAASAVVNGGEGFGQSLCQQAMELALDKARTCSVAVVELFDCGHIGRLGEYVELAAAQNMIGVVACNNHGTGLWQPPFGGIDRRMSPNPIAVGVPTGKGFPIVVDMTTSVVAEGKIRVKRNLGEDIPDGWALDADGLPTNDTSAFYGPPRGAILPFGGTTAHKGYALAVVVDILSGALGGAGCSRDPEAMGGRNGVFIMAIDIAAFTGLDLFEEEVDSFVEFLKSSRLMPGFDQISLPGEIEFNMRCRKQRDGLEVDEETVRQIAEAGTAVGVQVDL